MNFISALGAGYGAEQIFEFLANSFPSIGKRLKQAKQIGHSTEEILKQFNGLDKKKLFDIEKRLSQQPESGNPLIEAQQATLESSAQTQLPNIGKNLAMAGLGAYAAKKALPLAQTLIDRYREPKEQPSEPILDNTQQTEPEQQAQGNQQPNISPQNELLAHARNYYHSGDRSVHGLSKHLGIGYAKAAELIEFLKKENQNTTQNETGEIKNQTQELPTVKNIESNADVLWNAMLQNKSKGLDADNSAFLKIAKNMRTTGDINSREDFQKFYDIFQEKKKSGAALPTVLRESSREFENFKRPAPKEKIEPIPKAESAPTTETQGNLVLTPQGDIGEIKSTNKGIASVDVGGKIKTRKESELEKIPINQPDLADLYENLVKAIPEQARSSVINFAGYDADANELIFRPHNGAAYVYKDIPKEFADKLKNSMFKAKTTGENFYGAWSAGEGSRFAGLSQLIRDLQKQYGGKGKEYVRKYETLVDLLAEPEKAKREKKKKEKNERSKKRSS